MARTAGIVVRVESETRDKLNKIAQDNDVELATALYKLVKRIADGELDLMSLAGGVTPASVDVDSKIAEAIAPITGELAYLKKLVSSLVESNQGANIVEVEAIATEPPKNEGIEKNSPSRIACSERKATVRTNHTNSTLEAATGAESEQCPKCDSTELIKRGFVAWTDKKTGKKYRSGVRRECKACGHSFSLPFPEVIEI